MKKIIKKGLVFGAVYLVLLLCVFMMSNRIERLENNTKIEGVGEVTTLEYNSNS